MKASTTKSTLLLFEIRWCVEEDAAGAIVVGVPASPTVKVTCAGVSVRSETGAELDAVDHQVELRLRGEVVKQGQIDATGTADTSVRRSAPARGPGSGTASRGSVAGSVGALHRLLVVV
ncbi:hypothetical protein BHE74_00033909 [Ensete ventricosum]|nr:hypothetical protein BHE74_00033909 [Ensete ventricosum]RZS22409.1 hypothetical protein BHM03_00055173 [Ensete ventricosum]